MDGEDQDQEEELMVPACENSLVALISIFVYVFPYFIYNAREHPEHRCDSKILQSTFYFVSNGIMLLVWFLTFETDLWPGALYFRNGCLVAHYLLFFTGTVLMAVYYCVYNPRDRFCVERRG